MSLLNFIYPSKNLFEKFLSPIVGPVEKIQSTTVSINYDKLFFGRFENYNFSHLMRLIWKKYD